MSTTTSGNGDNHIADGKWKFDEEVTSVFPEMLKNSVPGYADMRYLTTSVAKNFLEHRIAANTRTPRNLKVTDIGASLGEAVAPLVDITYPSESGASLHQIKCDLFEISDPMLDGLRRRFQNHPNVNIHKVDLRYLDTFLESRAQQRQCTQSDLILSVLTAMFVPLEYRQRLFNTLYNMLKPEGMLLLVEKTLGDTAFSDALLTEQYYAMKREHGYTEDQIYSKRLALEGVLVPVKPYWNEDMLRSAGFIEIQPYWRSLQFIGLMAFK